MKVDVRPPNPDWPHDFALEAQQITQALATTVVAVHHIGSTAIPNIYAKPVIDMLVEVQAIAAVDLYHQAAMVNLGYEAMGEYGIPGRRYFRKENAQRVRTHHVHVFAARSPDVLRHLAFRDFMRAHPDCAQQYSALKQTLAAQHPDDIEGYMDGKHAFVKAMEQQALVWYRARA